MTAKSVSQVLSEVADLLEKPGAWTQKANARDRSGGKVGAISGAASCFCMAGAILRVTGGDYSAAEYVRVVLPEPEIRSHDWLVSFNDAPGRTQPEVVDALRRAAALAKKQGR